MGEGNSEWLFTESQRLIQRGLSYSKCHEQLHANVISIPPPNETKKYKDKIVGGFIDASLLLIKQEQRLVQENKSKSCTYITKKDF